MIGIVSDIQGNAVALKTVLACLDEMGIDEVFCLGDVAGYAPQINECCEILIERQIPCLLGNHDYYLAFDAPCPRSRAANVCLDYQRSVVEPAYKRWLGSLPKSFDHIPGVRMVHGGWNDPIDEYLYQLSEDYFARLDGDIFISGHTHVQGLWRLGAKTYCNPGSVGQPRDGDPRAAFAVLDGKELRLHRLAYDIDEIADASRAAGYEPYLFENLYEGTRIGGQVSKVRVKASLKA